MFKICKDIKNEDLEMRQVFAKVMDDLASKDERVVYLDADGNSGCGYVDNTNQGAYVYAKRTTPGIDFWASRTQILPGKPYVFVNNIYGLI